MYEVCKAITNGSALNMIEIDRVITICVLGEGMVGDLNRLSEAKRASALGAEDAEEEED